MNDLKELLDAMEARFNSVDFIADDPIQIPHSYSKKQNIEIAGFFASIFAWGQRKTIINKTIDFLSRMGEDPHDFILNHADEDRLLFSDFKHRTFQPVDAFAFLEFLQQQYRQDESLEYSFSRHLNSDSQTIEAALIGFRQEFIDQSGAMRRTLKHLSGPQTGSSCKRLNMYLRWMVRKDDKGVDFGIWETIRPDQLCLPLDVHVERVARKLHLLKRKQTDWKAVIELTDNLKKMDPKDPARYDFALFGMSLSGEY